MTGTRSINDLRAGMSADALAKVEARSREVRAELLLSEIRKQADDAQAEIAAALGLKQPARPGAAEDMSLSTLRKLAQTLGVQLDVSVVLPQGRRVSLTPFSAPTHAARTGPDVPVET